MDGQTFYKDLRAAGGWKVLIIDDDAFSRAVLSKVLRKFDYVACEAQNGVQGLQLFATERPDIIITDILMPEKEGLETIREIRAINPHVPIVAISGGGFAHNMDFLKMAAKLGANRTLAKPFRPRDILSVIRAVHAREDIKSFGGNGGPGGT